MAKVKLLKAARGKAKGEIVEISDKTAKLLKAIGKAKDYIAPTVRPEKKEEMKPKEKTEEPSAGTESSDENSTTSVFGFRRPYSRRDMTPEEE